MIDSPAQHDSVAIFGPNLRQLRDIFSNCDLETVMPYYAEGVSDVLLEMIGNGSHSFWLGMDAGTSQLACEYLLNEQPDVELHCTLPPNAYVADLSVEARRVWERATTRQFCPWTRRVELASCVLSFYPRPQPVRLVKQAGMLEIPLIEVDPEQLVRETIRSLFDFCALIEVAQEQRIITIKESNAS